ncbi:MAG TPA: VOC family protein [Anaerolineae bacterium]|nr:VOC family protein [Anaerolineae bacterium]
MTKNAICYVEWSCTDLGRTRAFLAGLFDWQFEPSGEDYLIIKAPAGPGGGVQKVDDVQPGASPVVYVEVDEIEDYLRRTKELGGVVAIEKTEIPTLGWYALIKDPDGNTIGLYGEHGPE